MAVAGAVLLGGCAPLFPSPDFTPEQIRELAKMDTAAVACVEGSGPVPGKWSILLLREGAQEDGSRVTVLPGCQVSYRPKDGRTP